MFCKAWIIEVPAKRRGSGKPYLKHKFLAFSNAQETNPNFSFTVEQANKAKRCGGKIIANVKAVDAPSWGDHYAELATEFKCEKCGCIRHAGLPREIDFGDWLTEVIASLSQPTESGIEL